MQECVKIAVCDDISNDRKQLVGCIDNIMSEYPVMYTVDEFSSYEVFLDCDVKVYNLVFIGLGADGTEGMNTAKILFKKDFSTKIVFCSSTSEFAVESYEIFALGYLIKPIVKEKLNAVIKHYLDEFVPAQSVEVGCGRATQRILVSDILWVESAGKKCVFHNKSGDKEVVTQLSRVFQTLQPYGFVRPIRYAVVPLSKIVEIKEGIVLLNGVTVPVSRVLRECVKKEFADYRWALSAKNRLDEN